MIVLGDAPTQTVELVSRLRDGLADGTRIWWEGDLSPLVDLDLVCHLPPPSGPGERLAEWRTRFRPGLCYYRQGPGFVEVRDTRSPATAARFVIDDDDLLAAFDRCLRPTDRSRLTAVEQEAVDVLAAEGLLLTVGDHVVVLPHRMKRWPVPAMAV